MPIRRKGSYVTFTVLGTLDLICKNVNFVSKLLCFLSFCLRCITKHNVAAVIATWNELRKEELLFLESAECLHQLKCGIISVLHNHFASTNYHFTTYQYHEIHVCFQQNSLCAMV